MYYNKNLAKIAKKAAKYITFRKNAIELYYFFNIFGNIWLKTTIFTLKCWFTPQFSGLKTINFDELYQKLKLK